MDKALRIFKDVNVVSSSKLCGFCPKGTSYIFIPRMLVIFYSPNASYILCPEWGSLCKAHSVVTQPLRGVYLLITQKKRNLENQKAFEVLILAISSYIPYNLCKLSHAQRPIRQWCFVPVV